MSSSYQYEHFDVSHIYLLTIFLKLYFSPPSFLTFFEKRAVKNSAQPYPWIFFTRIIVQHPKNPKTPRNLPPNSTVTGSGISTQLRTQMRTNLSLRGAIANCLVPVLAVGRKLTISIMFKYCS